MMDLHAAYWIAIAHLPQWNYFKINSLIKDIYIDKASSLEEFFALSPADWAKIYLLNEADAGILSAAKEQLPNNAFLAETLDNQGFELIPINSPDYSPTLKNNLKLTYSPPLLYVKGNIQLLKEDSVAIVGSRNASDRALQFTDIIARKTTENYQVVVSGFARGVDKAALDGSLKYHGHSIIVLPQGVLTFGSGYKIYYKQIIGGDVLVLSVFHPKAPWRAELAMARNPIIYGLAEHIYVAESSDKGGTWSGVRDGLRKGRTIFVRQAEEDEQNANARLISQGAIPVDLQGSVLESPTAKICAPTPVLDDADLPERIKAALTDKTLSAKEVCELVQCAWSARRMSDFLNSLYFVETVKHGRANKFRLKGALDPQQTIALGD